MTTRQQRRAAERSGRSANQSRWGWLALGISGVVVAGVLIYALWPASRLIRHGAPSWSPDGRQIVYYAEGDEGAAADLFVMNADGTGVRQLTQTSAAEGYPAWSPDGRRIAFEADAPDGNFDIYVMNVDGSGRERLTTDPKRDVGPAWSPDGTRIVFMSDRIGPEFDIYQMSAMPSAGAAAGESSGVERLTRGETNWFPQFSPDAMRLALHVWRDVHVMDLATRQLTRLTTAPADGMYPSWSPDGAKLAFMSARNGPVGIFTMDADGRRQQPLASLPPGNAIDPRWSPDGQTIVFVHTAAGSLQAPDSGGTAQVIYSVNVASGRLTQMSR